MYSSSIGGVGPVKLPPQPPPLPHHHPAKQMKVKDRRGPHPGFPTRITNTLSTLKIVIGMGLIALGVLALYQRASYSRTASGVWAGIVVIISGVLGVATVRMNASKTYSLFFLVSSVMSLVCCVLVIIYSATGLATDSGFPGGFVLDEVTGELIPVSQVNLPQRERQMMLNLLLIILGVLEILLTLPCCIICLREICACYDERALLMQAAGSEEARARNDWMLSWLQGQQQQSQHIFYSGASGIPYTKMPSPYHHPTMMNVSRATPPFVILPSSAEHSHQGSHSHSPNAYASVAPLHGQRQSPRESHRSSHRSSRQEQHYAQQRPVNIGRSSGHSRSGGHYMPAPPQPQAVQPAASPFTPLEVYPPAPQFFYATPGSAYPSPGSNMSHPSMAQLVPIHPAAASPHHHQYHHPHPHQLPPPPPLPPRWMGPEEYEAYLEGASQAASDHQRRQQRRMRSRDASGRRKRPRSKSGGAGAEQRSSSSKKRHQQQQQQAVAKGPTDSDLDRTYTGLDRELAEEFIEQTMDPAIVLERSAAAAKQAHAQSAPSDMSQSTINNVPLPPQPPMVPARTMSVTTESEAW